MRQQGREEEGKATFVMELLQQNFGDLPTAYVQQIAEADFQTLLLWTTKAFKAKTLNLFLQICRDNLNSK